MGIETVFLEAVYGLRNFFLTELFTSISALGSAVFAVVLIAGLLISDRKELGKLTAVAYGLNALIVYSMKYGISRVRPSVGQDLLPAATPHAFPSGHTAGAFVLATMLSYERSDLKYFFFGLAALVGFSRIYVGVHYPSDVIVGGLIGYGVSRLVLNYRASFGFADN
jgi:undecaprenyl-diphosphatase